MFRRHKTKLNRINGDQPNDRYTEYRYDIKGLARRPMSSDKILNGQERGNQIQPRTKDKLIRVEGSERGRQNSRGGKTIMSRQSYTNSSKQVRIDSGLHHLLKIESAKANRTIKALLEEVLAELLAVDNPYEKRTKS